MMNLIFRILLKIHSIYHNLLNKASLEAAKYQGMKVGKNFNMPDKIYFGTEPYLIEIGNDVSIAGGVRFVNHGGTANLLKKIPGYEDARIVGRIKIGNNCMLGLNSVIMQDVQVGNNCILGANSVLSQSMPDNTVFIGNPAQFLCTVEDYGDIVLKNNPSYPRELETDKKKLDQYLKENIPHKYKKARRIK
ncbi:acyltransferase [Chryseobacterium limigenitum]|uniref:Acetyltransferase (Isoleucine patch superfamily) n=1 Tax=Chryseobacterium limigenitum TaxID=1612149 RepID=A0A1K2IFI4_9FLAO|nr:acyltransferase [Chryseobacterium limigenitum]SFZ91143.1 Acetyltransferase (isoleucine patch superfamily) [Chryseobacterium limigenitum]